MISAGDFRNAAYNDHQSSAPTGARSNVPSSFLRIQHGDSFERDITPADSISNVDYRSVASSPRKANGFARITTERRPEEIQMSVRHNPRSRARSPMKETTTNITDKKESRGFHPSRVSGRVVERLPKYPTKNEKALRESASGKKADLDQWVLLRINTFQ